jgi:hypothetical protein
MILKRCIPTRKENTVDKVRIRSLMTFLAGSFAAVAVMAALGGGQGQGGAPAVGRYNLVMDQRAGAGTAYRNIIDTTTGDVWYYNLNTPTYWKYDGKPEPIPASGLPQK